MRSFRLPRDFRGRPGWYVQLWWIVQSTLFGMSPQFLYGWRRRILKLFGARIGTGVLIRPTVRVTYPWKVSIGDYSWIGDDVVLYSLGDIHIGDNCVISQRSYICAATHDHTDVAFPIRAIPIHIEPQVWIATDVFISAGVRIGHGAVVGARSTVIKDLPPMTVCIGSPASPRHPRW